MTLLSTDFGARHFNKSWRRLIHAQTFSRCFSGLKMRFQAGWKLNIDMLSTSIGSCGRRPACNNFRDFRLMLIFLSVTLPEFIVVSFLELTFSERTRASSESLPRLQSAGLERQSRLRNPIRLSPPAELMGSRCCWCVQCLVSQPCFPSLEGDVAANVTATLYWGGL